MGTKKEVDDLVFVIKARRKNIKGELKKMKENINTQRIYHNLIDTLHEVNDNDYN